MFLCQYILDTVEGGGWFTAEKKISFDREITNPAIFFAVYLEFIQEDTKVFPGHPRDNLQGVMGLPRASFQEDMHATPHLGNAQKAS